MESLRKFHSKVFSKKPSTLLADKAISPPKKLRDKRLRHSQSMPLRGAANIEEAYERSRPVYRGKQPLKASDVQLVVDPRGCPDAPIQHPAFDPVVGQHNFVSPIEESAHTDILDQFPPPPSKKPLPRRPKGTAPHLDLLDDLFKEMLPDSPLLERQKLLHAARAEMNHEPYHQLIVEGSPSTTSFPRYNDISQPQAWTGTTAFHDGLRRDEDEDDDSEKIMMHSNYSSKSLGVSVRLRSGPGRRVVVNPPARYDPRTRMHSNASSGTVMDTAPLAPSRRHGHTMEPRQRLASNVNTSTRQAAEFGYINQAHSHQSPPTSSRRYGNTMEPRQRLASNASTTTRQGAELGYMSQADPHYHSTRSRSRPPKLGYRS